jgi:hypothetical protein
MQVSTHFSYPTSSQLIRVQVVTFGFDQFTTLIGPTAQQADKSKACQLHLDLQYQGGFQYSVVNAVYHGYARLDPGVTGTFLSTYYFSQNAANTVYISLHLHSQRRKGRKSIANSIVDDESINRRRRHLERRRCVHQRRQCGVYSRDLVAVRRDRDLECQ